MIDRSQKAQKGKTIFCTTNRNFRLNPVGVQRLKTESSHHRKSLSVSKSSVNLKLRHTQTYDQKYGVDTVSELDQKLRKLNKQSRRQPSLTRLKNRSQYFQPQNYPLKGERETNYPRIRYTSSFNNNTSSLNNSQDQMEHRAVQKQHDMRLTAKIFSINRKKVIQSLGTKSTQYATKYRNQMRGVPKLYSSKQSESGKQLSRTSSNNMFRVSNKSSSNFRKSGKKSIIDRKVPNQKIKNSKMEDVFSMTNINTKALKPQMDQFVQDKGLELVKFVSLPINSQFNSDSGRSEQQSRPQSYGHY